jgi:group I intron endonuclease
MDSGVYGIHNKVNNKWYVGATKNIANRWNEHIGFLKNNKHSNENLQMDYNLFGPEAVDLEVLKECEIKKLDFYEKYYIKILNSTTDGNGYNETTGGKKGTKFSKRSKGKLSESLKKNINFCEHSANQLRNIAKKSKDPWNKGKKIKKKKTNDSTPKIKPGMTEDIISGMSYKEFIEKYNVSYGTFYNIKKFLIK